MEPCGVGAQARASMWRVAHVTVTWAVAVNLGATRGGRKGSCWLECREEAEMKPVRAPAATTPASGSGGSLGAPWSQHGGPLLPPPWPRPPWERLLGQSQTVPGSPAEEDPLLWRQGTLGARQRRTLRPSHLLGLQTALRRHLWPAEVGPPGLRPGPRSRRWGCGDPPRGLLASHPAAAMGAYGWGWGRRKWDPDF